jgi:hypothetical protein
VRLAIVLCCCAGGLRTSQVIGSGMLGTTAGSGGAERPGLVVRNSHIGAHREEWVSAVWQGRARTVFGGEAYRVWNGWLLGPERDGALYLGLVKPKNFRARSNLVVEQKRWFKRSR